jgi:hypothetical protein
VDEARRAVEDDALIVLYAEAAEEVQPVRQKRLVLRVEG